MKSTTAAKLSLLVIRSADIDRAVTFYQQLGLRFSKHSHGSGPQHYVACEDDLVFEIYPQLGQSTEAIRLGFAVANVDELVDTLEETGATVVSPPKDSRWGRRAIVRDFDGHTVELMDSPKQTSTET